jgi:hypothetical protein
VLTGNYTFRTAWPDTGVYPRAPARGRLGTLAASGNHEYGVCIAGTEATERGPELVENSQMLAAALAPEIGYDKASNISKKADLLAFSVERGVKVWPTTWR